ncbi:uncharacterized protein N7473_013042 [Penicillium subrubescens]|uniref:Rhodopsin domain-containing protein n=1 Tax=Penicillium subrubescens TaxID=1316194 RepID=A0A1Q5U3D9_9EURO|nr:uncharacterized protein N7473_013042 [Penicillium subrubescens]KAJ5875695.1 hypothetical protein N7473_013042 [Penicillium subrubescens]OKP06991.1 hypothetical protein PENSUB_6174 [Penicillium subrubescens]
MESEAYRQASRAPLLQGVMWTMAIVPLVFVLMRLYVRVVMKRVFGWDDFIIIVATGCLIAYAAVCHVAATIGLGRHLTVVLEENPNHVIDVALLCDIGEALAIMACTLGKTSFAVTLLRIVVHRWMIIVLWFVIVTMNLVNVLAALFIFVQCKDPRHLWNSAIPSECWPADVFTHFSLFVGAYSGAQDFVLALLPWTLVWNLQMKKKEKTGIAFAMSLGVFAGAASIVKTTYLVALSEKADFTWELAPLLYWAAVEDGLAITAAAISTLKPLLARVFPGSSINNNYNMISYSTAPNRKVFDNSQGETRTDIGHSSIHERGSQTAILAPLSPKRDETINLTTEVSVTYNRPS